jgi:hypothetical protein
MGSVLNLFDVDKAAADPRARNVSGWAISYASEREGVPYAAFVAPPVPVFDGSARPRLGLGRLSRDEETVATAHFLAAALVVGGRFVPASR